MATETRCAFVYSGGNPCEFNVTHQGYCSFHIRNKEILNKLNLKVCKTLHTIGSGDEHRCLEVHHKDEKCQQCILRSQPRVRQPYPNTEAGIEALYRGDTPGNGKIIDLMNLVSLRCPAREGEIWWSSYRDSFVLWPLKAHELTYGFKLTDPKIRIYLGNAIEEPEVYYEFQRGEDPEDPDDVHVFIMYPEEGYVVDEHGRGDKYFCAADWVRIFGCPEFR